MIVTEFPHLWKTVTNCHSLVMKKNNKKLFLQLSEEPLNYLQIKFYCSKLQLNATLHNPCTFSPLGKERRVGLAEFHHPGLTHTRLSPWPSSCQVHLSSPAQHRGPTHSVTTHWYFQNFWVLEETPRGGKSMGSTHITSLEDSGPRS